MPTPSFTQRFIKLRPFAYHVTDPVNLPRLQRLRSIQPTADLLALAGKSDLLRVRRKSPLLVNVDGDTIILKDQKPLLFANVEFEDGWTPADFVAFLNRHVYFRPGSAVGPVAHGVQLLTRYSGALVLRVPTNRLFAANPSPLFSACNSGAPRMHKGRKVKRGLSLFQPDVGFPATAGRVVELVFRSTVVLPDETDVIGPDGDPQRL